MPGKWFICDCYTHAIQIDVDDEEYHNEESRMIFFSFWERAPENQSLWERIKYAWKVITTGKYYSDQIVLSKKAAKEIGEYLNTL